MARPSKPSSSPAGRRLRQLREESGLSQQAIADALHVNRAALSKWEAGDQPITTGTIYSLLKVLQPKPEQAADFILACKEDADPQWVSKQSEARRYDYAVYPALDPEWLKNHEPAHERAGMLLEAFQERAGVKGTELREALGISNAYLSQWKSGERRFFPDKNPNIHQHDQKVQKMLRKLKPLLKLDDEEVGRLAAEIEASNAAFAPGHYSIHSETTHLGAASKANGHPRENGHVRPNGRH